MSAKRRVRRVYLVVTVASSAAFGAAFALGRWWTAAIALAAVAVYARRAL